MSAYQSGRELAGSFGVDVTLRPGQVAASGPRPGRRRAGGDRRAGRGRGRSWSGSRTAGWPGSSTPWRTSAGSAAWPTGSTPTTSISATPAGSRRDLERYQRVTPDAVRERGRAATSDARGPMAADGRSAASRRPSLRRSTAQPARRQPRRSPFRAPRPEVRTLALRPRRSGCIPRRDLPIVAATVVGRGRRRGARPGQGGLASLTADMMDEGTTSRTVARARPGRRGDGDEPLDQLRLGRLVRQLPVPDAAPRAEPRPGGGRAPQPDLPRVGMGARPRPDARRRSGPSATAPRPAPTAACSSLSTPGHIPTASRSTATRRPSPPLAATTSQVPPRPLRPEPGRLGRGRRRRPRRDRRGRSTPAWPAGRGRATPPPKSAHAGPNAGRTHPPARPARRAAGGRPGRARRACPGSTPTSPTLLVLNQILGGQFTSRLNAKLREEKGFTYGVRSHFDFRRGAGPFSISASLQADRLAEALDDLRREVEALLGDRPPTAAELDDARRSLIEGQARQFETPSAPGLPLRRPVRPRPPARPSRPLRRAARRRHRRLACRAAGRARSTPRPSSPSWSPTPIQVIGGLEHLDWAEVEKIEG